MSLLLNRKDLDINTQDTHGYTGIMWACMKGKRKIVSELLQCNAFEFMFLLLF